MSMVSVLATLHNVRHLTSNRCVYGNKGLLFHYMEASWPTECCVDGIYSAAHAVLPTLPKCA